MSLLAINNVSLGYGAKTVVKDLTFSLERGEIFGLLGPNGSGKTTLVSAIEGLHPVMAGEILLNNIPTSRASVRSQIGVMLQVNAYPNELTTAELVRLFAGLYGKDWSKKCVLEWLQGFHLENLANQHVSTLSGGQQQMVALAIGLINQPALSIFDEPTTGLDPQSRRMLWESINRLRDEGHTVMLTTHSMEEAAALCNRIAILINGHIRALDTPQGLIMCHANDPWIKKIGHGAVTLDDVFIGLVNAEKGDQYDAQ